MLWAREMKSSLSTQVLATNSTYRPLTFPLKFRVSGAVFESVQVQEPEKKQQQNSMRKLFDQIRTSCLGKLASFHMIRNSKTYAFNLAFFFLCFWYFLCLLVKPLFKIIDDLIFAKGHREREF